jgi:hypothetical protein
MEFQATTIPVAVYERLGELSIVIEPGARRQGRRLGFIELQHDAGCVRRLGECREVHGQEVNDKAVVRRERTWNWISGIVL